MSRTGLFSSDSSTSSSSSRFKEARASNKSLLILRMSRFIFCILCKLHGKRFSWKSRVATDRQLHTREFQHKSTMRFCYHQNPIKRQAGDHPGLPCDNRQCHLWAYSPTSGETFLNTARSTRRPQSSRMNARRAEALSSARLANAVPGLSCPLQWSQVSEFLLIKLVSRSSWQGSKHPL